MDKCPKCGSKKRSKARYCDGIRTNMWCHNPYRHEEHLAYQCLDCLYCGSRPTLDSQQPGARRIIYG